MRFGRGAGGGGGILSPVGCFTLLHLDVRGRKRNHRVEKHWTKGNQKFLPRARVPEKCGVFGAQVKTCEEGAFYSIRPCNHLI